MEREYKIYKTDLWYSVFRKKDVDEDCIVQYLNRYGKRSPNKRTAKAFLNREDAVSGLIISRRKWEGESVWY